MGGVPPKGGRGADPAYRFQSKATHAKRSAALACLLLSAASLASAQPATTGAALFENRCVMCHSGDPFSQGPSLTGVVGRPAGAVAGFAYSPALKRSGLTWTRGALDRFLADPGKAVPGTAMPVRVVDPAQRSAIISYLASGK